MRARQPSIARERYRVEEGGARKPRHLGAWREEGLGAGLLGLESSLPFLSSAIDGGDASSVSAFLTWCLFVLPSGEKRLLASLKLK